MKILALSHHPQMGHEAVKQGPSRLGLWFTSIWIAMGLLAASAAAASNDLSFFGYKPQAVIGKTTPLEVLGAHGPLQSVVITPADGLTVEGIREKALEPGRRIRKGAKLWEFQLTVAPGTPAGERSVLLKTPGGDSKTETIVLVPYVPVIKSFKILSATSSGAAVELELVVLDEGGKLGPGDPVSVNYGLDCGGGGVRGAQFTRVSKQMDPQTAIIRTTVSQVGSHASGTCEFTLSVANGPGYKSAEQRTTVTFH
ncbi:MAG: hypothetical protein LAO21_11565 [Acidobacteriia bacterium]|nr:hypothetical protein [Terriglobia bacterium]